MNDELGKNENHQYTPESSKEGKDTLTWSDSNFSFKITCILLGFRLFLTTALVFWIRNSSHEFYYSRVQY